jgi:hypothetical protein
VRLGAVVLAAALSCGVVLAACRPVDPTQQPGAALSRAWRAPVDGIVQARPLVVSGTTAGDVVVVATESDNLYGFNATTGAKLWGPVNIGTAEPLADIHSLDPSHLSACGDLDPLGITSNPVYDPSSGTVYAVGEVEGATDPTHYHAHIPEFVLVGVNPATGADTGTGPDTGLAPIPIVTTSMPAGMTTTNPANEIEAEQQRAGLAAFHGVVYVGFGGLAGDCGPYHGWLISASEANGHLVGTFETATKPATNRAAAVWGTLGPAVDTAGNVYTSTGSSKGPYPTSGTDYSMAVVQVPPGFVTAATNFFQTPTWESDDQNDADLGSAGPVLVAGDTQIFALGKQHTAFLLDTSDLGGDATHETPIASLRNVCPGDSDGASVASGNTVFVGCRNGPREVIVQGSGASSTLQMGWTATVNANAPVGYGNNLVWSIDTTNSTLYGLSPSTGNVIDRATLSLNSQQHFPTPAFGDGDVFVGADSSIVALH